MGKTLRELATQGSRGVRLKKLVRVGQEIAFLPDTTVSRGDTLQIIGAPRNVQRVAKDAGYVERATPDARRIARGGCPRRRLARILFVCCDRLGGGDSLRARRSDALRGVAFVKPPVPLVTHAPNIEQSTRAGTTRRPVRPPSCSRVGPRRLLFFHGRVGR